MRFSDKIRMKCLLWCDRHCCLCKKSCAVDIELHHIVPQEKGGSNKIDNAIPLCFDCHCKVEHYNERHPRGSKLKPNEQEKRRDQVYEEFTRQLVPPIHYEVTQRLPGNRNRTLPDVGFDLSHCGDSLPVKVRVEATVLRGKNSYGTPEGPYYSGKKLWNLNPRHTTHGHLTLPGRSRNGKRRLEVRVKVSLIDCYEREHHLLPVGWVYMCEKNDWYFEP